MCYQFSRTKRPAIAERVLRLCDASSRIQPHIGNGDSPAHTFVVQCSKRHIVIADTGSPPISFLRRSQ
jgi:hypothetical protein